MAGRVVQHFEQQSGRLAASQPCCTRLASLRQYDRSLCDAQAGFPMVPHSGAQIFEFAARSGRCTSPLHIGCASLRIELIKTLTTMLGIANEIEKLDRLRATASVVALEPAEVEISPENAGSRVPDRVPPLISYAAFRLLINVCVSLVPTIAPTGAPTAEVVLTPVRKTIPLEPGSPSPAGALTDCGSQVFTAVQPYKF